MPKNWASKTQQEIKLDTFDILLANHPFGKDIKVEGEEKLSQYILAHKTDKKGINKLQKQGKASTLFLERNLQLVKKGGKIGIILPEPYFALPSYKDAINFMFENNNIMWIIDFPQNTFRPHNNAKCCAIIIQKGEKQQEYINMAVAEYIGHDHQGRAIYNVDKTIKDDTLQIIKEINERQNNKGKLINKYDRKLTFKIKAETVKEKNILVPRFYWQAKLDRVIENAKKNNIELISIQQLIYEEIIESFDGHGSPKGELKGLGDVPYIRVKDIVNWQSYIDVTSLIPRDEYERIFKESKTLKPRDILREIIIIHIKKENNKYGITPEYLLYALSHKYVWEQTENKVFYEPCLPNIADRWKELMIPIFKDKKIFEIIKTKADNIVKKQWDSKKSIQDLRKNFNAYLI